MCNSEQGEERKSYDAYAGEEEEEEQREKKTCWTEEAEKKGKNNECFKVLQSCLEQKLGNFFPYLFIPQGCHHIRSRPREIFKKSFWFFLKKLKSL